jgi:hypothetical protein
MSEMPNDRPIVDRPDQGEDDLQRGDGGQTDGEAPEGGVDDATDTATTVRDDPDPDVTPRDVTNGPPGGVPRTTTTGDPAADVRTSPHAGATTWSSEGDDLDDADQVHEDGRHTQRRDPDRPDRGEGRPS